MEMRPMTQEEQLYHICQFAEPMHKNGAEYEPKTGELQKAKGDRRQER